MKVFTVQGAKSSFDYNRSGIIDDYHNCHAKSAIGSSANRKPSANRRCSAPSAVATIESYWNTAAYEEFTYRSRMTTG